MSRIGKLPITIPSGVKVGVTHNVINVEGPRGQLERSVPQAIAVAVEGDEVICTRPDDSREHRSLHGLTRTLVANMVTGVSAGYRKDLELVGVGYRVAEAGQRPEPEPRLLAPGSRPTTPGNHVRGDGPHSFRDHRHQQGAGRPDRGRRARAAARPSPTRARA